MPQSPREALRPIVGGQGLQEVAVTPEPSLQAAGDPGECDGRGHFYSSEHMQVLF